MYIYTPRGGLETSIRFTCIYQGLRHLLARLFVFTHSGDFHDFLKGWALFC